MGICSRATEKSRIVCSYSHPGLIRYQQSRLWSSWRRA